MLVVSLLPVILAVMLGLFTRVLVALLRYLTVVRGKESLRWRISNVVSCLFVTGNIAGNVTGNLACNIIDNVEYVHSSTDGFAKVPDGRKGQ